MVIWLVGLSGAGKTTVGREVYRLWKTEAPNTVLVDGDDVRRMFGQDTEPADYTVQGRRRNAERIVEICSWLDRQDINVVCCILCLFDDLMIENRTRYSKYFQVFLDTPIDVLKSRDPKGIYARAARGEEKNVVGLDLSFSPPSASDMTINTGPGALGPLEQACRIMETAGIKK